MITDNAYYRAITDKKRQAVIVRSEIERFTNRFFFDRDFIYVEPPVFHEAIANKKAEIYLPLYNGKYSLSSSNALFMGMYASEFRRVFTISKCFRDENDTRNHLIEFNILEAEMLDFTFEEMLELIQFYLEFILDQLIESNAIQGYSELWERIKRLRDNFAPRVMTYDEFVSNVSEDAFDKYTDISDIDYLLTKKLKEIVIIVDYPARFAAWTSKKKENGKSVAMNILLPESYGELCEGCERTNDVSLLQNKIRLAKADAIQWYVDAVKKIQTNRCGFGLGIDRLVRWIMGADNISDTRFFPRVKTGGSKMSKYENRAIISLLNMCNEMFRKNIEIRRITKTCALLLMSGLSPNDIPKKIMDACLSSQKEDGGFIGNTDTMWNIKFLEFYPQYKKERDRAIAWLVSDNGDEEGFGRSKRDMHRIPVTGLALYLLPEIATEKNLEWLEKTWSSELNSLTYKAAYSILAFTRNHYKPKTNEKLIPETAAWLSTQQEANGGFAPWLGHPVGENVYCTAVALLALISMQDDAYKETIKRGYNYLCDTQLNSGIWAYHEIEDGASWGLFALSQAEKYLEV